MDIPAEPSRRVPALVEVPMANLAPGSYEAVLTFRHHGLTVQREMPIVVQAAAEH